MVRMRVVAVVSRLIGEDHGDGVIEVVLRAHLAGNLELPDTRLSQFQAFAHLKTFTLVRYGKGYPDETQAKVNALLPKVDVKFVK